jgi:hypothetical protein
MPHSSKNPNLTVIQSWRAEPRSIEKFQFIYHFLPHPEYKRRATLLSPKALIIYCILIILTTGLFRLVPKILPGVLGYASNVTVKDLFTDTNKMRKDAGLPTLVLNEKLSEAAKEKAKNMFAENYWAHVSPDGKEPWDFILSEKYDYIYAGENLAKNFSTSRDVVDAWYKSPSHRDNLLSPNYDEIGFAVVNGVLDGYETTLVVQMFGRPRNPNQIATVMEQDKVLEEEAKQTATVPMPVSKVPEKLPIVSAAPKVLPAVDVSKATKSISLAFGGFIGLLLILDIWYSRKKGILKFTGHTFAHLTYLIIAVLSIWLVLRPGIIL